MPQTELSSQVLARANELLAKAQRELKGQTLYAVVFGAHLFGTADDQSDVDVRGVFLPDIEEVLLGHPKESLRIQSEATKDDLVLWSVQHFRALLLKGDTNAVELLFSDSHPHAVLQSSKAWEVVKEAGRKLLHRPLRGFWGFALALSQRYDIKSLVVEGLEFLQEILTDKEDGLRLRAVIPDIFAALPERLQPIVRVERGTDGRDYLLVGRHSYLLDSFMQDIKRSVATALSKRGERVFRLAHRADDEDWKALHHAIRVALEAITLHKTGHLTFPLPDAQWLYAIKRGQFSKEEVRQIMARILYDLEVCEASDSALPTEPTDEFPSVLRRLYGIG